MKKSKIMLSALMFVMGAQYSNAIPVLSENAAQNTTEALTLYPDSNDPKLFYYMPNSSGFRYDPATKLPMIGFTYWGLGKDQPVSNAGAYLTWTSHLFSSDAQKAALNDFMKSGKSVAVIPLQSSIINLSTTKDEGKGQPLGRLFEEFNFSSVGGLAEADIGVNAVLTGIGAKVFKKAIENPTLMKTDFCYKVEGLGPEMKATAKIHFDKVYEHFSTQFSVNHWFVKASYVKEVEKLVQNGSVEINITGGDAKLEEYITEIANRIAEKLFVYDLTNTPAASKETSGWSFIQLSLKDTKREERKDVTYVYSKRNLTTREFCLPISMSGLKPYLGEIVKNADEESLSNGGVIRE